ncbi:MAG: ATP-binding cassette domain-containing protein [Clostridiales Family XIII bacterium]|jgi:alpha-D-ribose 1-methylphosphonate 5-triphosphate synthase subunit PhnL|nr:ATP-binding cassette domain-containing protein [Clostridiales Family XIII bacterium]
MNTILSVKNLNKTFRIYEPDRTIKTLENISFDLAEREFLGIVGASGSGKSTILRCVYQTYRVEYGEIRYRSVRYGNIDLARAADREILHIRKKEIAYVSQFLEVLPRITARQSVENSALEVGASYEEAQASAEEMLAYFHLPSDLWDIYPHMFSGGEKLRLNLAKSMVKKPRLLLLDEPTASLDADSKKLVRGILVKLNHEGASMIGIFHDLDFMDGLCNRTLNITVR